MFTRNVVCALVKLENLKAIHDLLTSTSNYVSFPSEMVANQAEIGTGWKFNVKPTYVIAITQKKVFRDNRIIHRATTIDLETGKLN